MALNLLLIEKRPDSGDMDQLSLRPAGVDSRLRGNDASWKLLRPQNNVMPAEAGTHVTSKMRHARRPQAQAIAMNRAALQQVPV